MSDLDDTMMKWMNMGKEKISDCFARKLFENQMFSSFRKVAQEECLPGNFVDDLKTLYGDKLSSKALKILNEGQKAFTCAETALETAENRKDFESKSAPCGSWVSPSTLKNKIALLKPAPASKKS